MSLPVSLYRAEQVRELDRQAIEQHGIAGYTLMQRAAEQAMAVLLQYFAVHKRQGRLLVICGGGNNGGDGYIIARLAREQAIPVDVVAVVPEAQLQGDARQAAADWQRVYGNVLSLDEITNANANADSNVGYGVIVDALLGTGLQRPVQGDFLAAINFMNTAGCPILAIDVPSGLQADTGQAMDVAVQATHTISFIGLKQGLLTGAAADYCGQLHFADLAVPAAVFATVPAAAERITAQSVAAQLPPRLASAHKGDFGHVLCIGGAPGMSGAIQMAATAALRVGAGLVSVITAAEHAAIINTRQPELMCHAIDWQQATATTPVLTDLLDKASVMVVGPGLGQSALAQQLFERALQYQKPMIIDADALNLLARADIEQALAAEHQWLLTPHPGEAGRLLNCSSRQVQSDRFAAVSRLAQHYQAVTVLKGAGTLVASPAASTQVTGLRLCDLGHPGMASGGMGDVLTGVLAGLCAQGLTLYDAASTGVWLHARAAELAAAEGGQRGLLATDLMPFLQRLVNP